MQTSLHQRFADRTLGVATMHGKEKAIVPALTELLPLAGHEVIEFDTDAFGAFSGEVKRRLEPREAAEAKAREGARISGLDLVIASEGSFFPYPPTPFIPCDEEWLVLVDLSDDRVFAQRHLSLRTVFGGERCTTEREVLDFAKRMMFPEHQLVMRPQETYLESQHQIKGISTERDLIAHASTFLSEHGALWLETDIRAMANPTRMEVIRETAERFAKELVSTCPACEAIHFRITDARPGLPCSLCGWPTNSTRCLIRSCESCGHSQDEPREDGKLEEDPMYCDNCNP